MCVFTQKVIWKFKRKPLNYQNPQDIYIYYTYIRFSECQLSALVILFRRPVGPMAGGDLSDASMKLQ